MSRAFILTWFTNPNSPPWTVVVELSTHQGSNALTICSMSFPYSFCLKK